MRTITGRSPGRARRRAWRRLAAAQLGAHLRQLVVDGARGGQLLELPVDVVAALAERRDVLERAGRLELLDRRRACAHLLGLVRSRAACQADVGHLLADAGRGLGDLHLGLGGGVLRLDDLLLGAEGLDLGAELRLVLDELLLLGLELADLESSDCSSVCASCLRSSAIRARSSLPAASAWRAWVSSLTPAARASRSASAGASWTSPRRRCPS
jgi:hypothetical protein